MTDAYSFPDADLMTTLIDLYFTRHNYLHPLLHRPTFERAFTDGLHLYDPIFGAVVLLVCALGSRWTTDPRVFTKGIDDPGWVFFEQVTLPPPSGRDPAALVDLQLYGVREFSSHEQSGDVIIRSTALQYLCLLLGPYWDGVYHFVHRDQDGRR